MLSLGSPPGIAWENDEVGPGDGSAPAALLGVTILAGESLSQIRRPRDVSFGGL